MRHPFRRGQRYRNQDGEYEVIQITEPNMVLGYADGRTIESSIALQARIWERLQEEEELGEGEFDLGDDSSTGANRNTDDIRWFVNQVLHTLKQPWPPDITDHVCLAIEKNPNWLSYYQKLVKEFGILTVNTSIGYYVREVTGMENTGRTATSKSRLIKSYGVLAASQP